jgi:hypothetical protein
MKILKMLVNLINAVSNEKRLAVQACIDFVEMIVERPKDPDLD